MNLKALIEKRNAALNELDSIAKTIETEVRGLNEGETSRIAELQAEVSNLDTSIKFAESRSASVEVIEDNKEERSVEQDIQFETRAVEQFLRGVDGEEIREVRAAAAPVQTGQAPGSILIPTQLSNLIVAKLYEVASIFSRTRNFTPVAGVLEVLREQDHGTAGFVGELTDLETSNFAMDKVRLTQKRAGTAIELSQHIINDSGIDVVNYAIGLLSKRLAMTLDRNILVGTGDANNQFEGMLGHADIGNVVTAASGTVGTDDLVDLYNSVHPDYQAGSVFVMSRATFNTLVKLKDANNHYYFIRDITAGAAGYRLFGLPVLIMDAMPGIAANQQAVLMANFNEAYATMTKKGLNLQHITGDSRQALRGAHLLLLDGYFDGKVLNPNAAKFLKIKA